MIAILTACKKQEAAPEPQAKPTAQKVETARPTGFDAERELTLKLGGRDCDVHIVCEPDNERPTVKDETGEYLEQKAQLEITCGDETIVNRTFTKDDFERYLSKDEAARLVIQGMLIDPSKTSTASTIYLAAQLCSPSDEEDCRPFSITYNVGNDTFSMKQEPLRIIDPDEEAEEEGV